MKAPWKNYLGNNPALYARKVLKACDLRHPPICEKTVADYLGLDLVEFTTSGIPGYFASTRQSKGLEILTILDTACAWLMRSPGYKPRIYVRQDTRAGRKRLSIFHECGHATLPWHEKLDYLCTEKDLHPRVHKRVEQEAFLCGAEFLMPREMFVDDALTLETGIPAIEQLRNRYEASMEATAIRYAHTHPQLCAVVMVEPAKNRNPKTTRRDHVPPEQLALPFMLPPRSNHPGDGTRCPLAVRYCVRSRRFPKYIRAGTGIREGNRVFEAWATGIRVKDEIPASVFGSSANWAYHAECLPLGRSGKVMVLLWLPDHQPRLLQR